MVNNFCLGFLENLTLNILHIRRLVGIDPDFGEDALQLFLKPDSAYFVDDYMGTVQRYICEVTA